MKRGLLVLGLLLVFGAGMLAGSLLTPGAQAEPTVTGLVKPGQGGALCVCPYCQAMAGTGNVAPYTSGQGQIFVVPAPDDARKMLTLFIDGKSGDLYMLTYSGSYYLDRISRR